MKLKFIVWWQDFINAIKFEYSNKVISLSDMPAPIIPIPEPIVRTIDQMNGIIPVVTTISPSISSTNTTTGNTDNSLLYIATNCESLIKKDIVKPKKRKVSTFKKTHARKQNKPRGNIKK